MYCVDTAKPLWRPTADGKNALVCLLLTPLSVTLACITRYAVAEIVQSWRQNPLYILVYMSTEALWLHDCKRRHDGIWRLPRYTRRRNGKWSQDYIKIDFLRHAGTAAPAKAKNNSNNKALRNGWVCREERGGDPSCKKIIILFSEL